MHPQLRQGKESHRPTPSQSPIIEHSVRTLWLLSILVVSGCATEQNYRSAPIESRKVTPSAPSLSSPSDESEDQATPLPEDDIYIERAQYYQRLASGSDESSQIDATLSAAEYYIQANDFDQAERTAGALTTTAMNQVQRERGQVILAYVAYSNGNFNAALQQLEPLLIVPPALILGDDAPRLNQHQVHTNILSRQQLDALLLSSFCHQQLGDFDAALEALIRREAGLAGTARAETTRYTWQVINSIDVDQRQLLMATTNNALVRNRLEQSLGGQVAQLDQAPSQFTQWRDDQNSQESPSQLRTIPSDWGPESPNNVALLLPLSSQFNTASQAFLDGFKYQNELNNLSDRPLINVYDIGDNPFQIEQYYAAAMQAGAQVVIGPLGKTFANQLGQRRLNLHSPSSSDVNTASSDSDYYRGDYQTEPSHHSSSIGLNSVPTILLGGDMALSGDTVRLTLSPEREGQTIAEKAFTDGHINAVVLAPNTGTAQRIVAAFNDRWLQLGGKVSEVISYSPSQYDHSVELKQLFDINESEYRHKKLSDALGLTPNFAAYQRSDIDMIFMLADNDSGRLVRPQINFFGGSKLAVYATSTIYNGIQDVVQNVDLERTHFPVMPWVLRSENVAHYAGSLNELFALGSDAYRVAGNFRQLRDNANLAINGNTGKLSIARDGRVSNDPVWAQFIQGEATATNSMGIDLAPLEGVDHDDLEPRNKQGVYNDSNWDSRNARRKTGS